MSKKKVLIAIYTVLLLLIFVGCGNKKHAEQPPPPIEEKITTNEETAPSLPAGEKISEPIVEKNDFNLGMTLEQFKTMSKEKATSALVMDQDIQDPNFYYGFSNDRKNLAEGFLKGEVSLNVEGDVVNLADKINFDSTTIKFDDNEEIFQLEYSFDQSLNPKNYDYGSEIGREHQIMRGSIDKSTGMIKEIAMLVKNPEPKDLIMSYITLGVWLSVFNPELTEPQRKEFLFEDLEAYHSIDYLEKSDSRGCNIGVRGNYKYAITVIDKNEVVISLAPKQASPPPKILNLGLTPEQFKERAVPSKIIENVELAKIESKGDTDIYEGEFTFKGEYQLEKSRPPVSGVKQKFKCSVDAETGLIRGFLLERENKSETNELLAKLSCIVFAQVLNSELTPETFDAFIIKHDEKTDNGLKLEIPLTATRHAVYGNVRYIIEPISSPSQLVRIIISAKDYGFPASYMSSWWWLSSF